MSRSQPSLTNPAKHFFQWSGSKGTLSWWDKENAKEVQVKIPFEFLVLDELSTITGYDEQANSGYYSNEVRSVASQPFTVKTKMGVKEVGLYKDLTCRAKGAKYTKSIYLVHKGPGGEYMIGNLKASGAALTAWIELTQKHHVENGKVILTGSTEGKKGATTFQIPTFEWLHSKPEEDAEAVRLDKELQVYLSHYFAVAQLPVDELPSDVDQSVGLATDEQKTNYVKPSRSKSVDGGFNDEDFDSLSKGLQAEGLSQEEIDSIPF